MSNNDLLYQLESASNAIKRAGMGVKQEIEYAAAYQRCVQAGLKPQLKRKYRGR